MADSYQQLRQRNIDSNRKLLLSLKLSAPVSFEPLNRFVDEKSLPPKKTSSQKSKKRKFSVDENAELPVEGAPAQRRRSMRLQTPRALGSDAEYIPAEQDDSDSDERNKSRINGNPTWFPPRDSKRMRNSKPKPKSLKGGRPDPKIRGHQIGTEVGDWWDSRMACSQAGVHAPPVSGISGNETDGCFSVALSGGYEDDVDLGYAFTYTGCGGRALSGTPNNPKNLRTAPQTSDQTFTAMNACLKSSCESGHSIRVIRGYKNHSPFAPETGYRYDGLYRVEKCWREAGQSGYQVCKFAFVRLPGQPKIPVKEGREDEAHAMYRDMGFTLEALPPTPEKRAAWTKRLAASRIEASQPQ